MSLDFAELFTDAVRLAAPLTAEKKLAMSFDCRGPTAMVEGDGTALASSVQRLLRGVIDVIDVGFLVFYSQTEAVRPGKCRITVKAAGTGLLAADARITRVLHRLGLGEDGPAAQGDRPRLHRAEGICPDTGATVQFASLPSEGALFSIEWILPAEVDTDPAAAQADAAQARAWIVHDDEVAAESLVRRLQRLGWATSKFDGPQSAARRLRAMADTHARPSLLVAVECSSVSPASVQMLRQDLTMHTQSLYAVLAGSPTLLQDDGVPGFELRVHPFSPAELAALTTRAVQQRHAAAGDTLPGGLARSRPRPPNLGHGFSV